jgi:hypothetical protein
MMLLPGHMAGRSQLTERRALVIRHMAQAEWLLRKFGFDN